MSQDQTDFQKRLAHIAAAHDTPPAPNAPLAARAPSRAPSLTARVLMLLPGLIVIAVVLGWVLSSSGFRPSVGPSGEKLTMLERNLLDRMSAEDIERMNTDPDLAGKSTMQKLLLSH